MSRSVSIDFKCSSRPERTVDVLSAFLSSGWTLNSYGSISFLPVKDDNRFDWNAMPYNEANTQYLFQVIDTKDAFCELTGVTIQWHNTDIGVDLLLWSDGRISFNLSINRCTLPDEPEFTDMNWYMEKILPSLKKAKLHIESVVWSEHV